MTTVRVDCRARFDVRVVSCASGARARAGRFRGRLVGRPSRSARAFRAFARGTWRARFDVVADPRTGASTPRASLW